MGRVGRKKFLGKDLLGMKKGGHRSFLLQTRSKNCWIESEEQRETRSLANSLLGFLSGVACGLSGAGQLDLGAGKK